MHGKLRLFSVGLLTAAVLGEGVVEAQIAKGSPALPAEVSDRRELEAFRGELGTYIQGMKGVAEGMGLSSNLDVALQGLPSLTIAELRTLRSAFVRSPGWRAHPQTLKGLLRVHRPKGAPLRMLGAGPRITADDCPTAINAGFTQTDVEIATDVALAADVILEAIPNDVLGAIARGIAVGLWAIPQGVLRAFEHLYNIAEACQSETFETGVNTQLTTIFNNDNSNRTQIIANDDSNRIQIVNNDNANRALIVANDNTNTTSILTAIADLKAKGDANTAAILDLTLRTQIEADLAEADSATPVAWYVTPDANGGHLDLVRDIVAETIANVQAAGGTVGQAEAFFAQGEAAQAAQDFKAAYRSYRKAYKAAIQ